MNEKLNRPARPYGMRDEQDVLNFVNDSSSGIAFIRFIFPDILGRPMDFTIPASELEAAFADGKGFDGSSVAGFVRIEESDLIIKPDPRTFRLLPWKYHGFEEGLSWREGLIFGDILDSKRNPYEGDSRAILKKNLARSRDEFGFDDLKCGPEYEFFIFPSDREPVATDSGGYFFSGRHGEIRKEIQLHLHQMGIETEYDHHEVAHGQHEIDLRYLSAVEAADVGMILRYVTKKVCRMHGLYATFMPKPLNGQNGSGLHVHQSLWKNGTNVFFDAASPDYLSSTCRNYIAGIMNHALEITAVLNQWVNSYKRLIEGYEAPVYIAWGQKNRSAYIRVPEYQPGREKATRIELRAGDPGCNLYLSFALMLASGLDGIRRKIEPASRVDENIYGMSSNRRKKLGIRVLPRNLEEAIEIMGKSRLVRETLGDHIFDGFTANKTKEIEDYRSNVAAESHGQVSGYEIARYLPFL